MLEIHHRAAPTDPHQLTLTLAFDERQKSRHRVILSSGEAAALHLERGSVLRGGERLRLGDGRVVLVIAAPEHVSTVRAADPRALARIAYHLGNRHVAVELGDGWLRYHHDHVIDAMVRELGGAPLAESSPFEPEAGAYGHAHDH